MGRQDIKAGGAFVEVTLRDQLSNGLKKAGRRLQNFGSFVAGLGAKMAGAATAIAAPVAFMVATFASFGDQMAAVRGVTSASEAAFASLTEQAKELGRTTSFTATQVAGAMLELGRAGFKPDAIEQAIAGVLDLSRATGTDLSEATAIAGAALRGFRMQSAEMGRVVDVMTATANNSSQTLTDLGEALKMVAPLAVEAKQKIEATAGAVGVLADNGIRGTMAGTALARAFKNLSTEGARKKLKALGVEAVDADRNLRPITDILKELGDVTRDMGSADRLAIFEVLFGRASAAAAILASANARFESLNRTLVNAEGVAASTAEMMDDTLGGAFRILMSAVEGVSIAVGETLAPDLRELAEAATGVSGEITAFVENNRALLVTIAKGIAIFGAAGAAIAGVGLAIMFAGGVLSGLVTIAGAVFTAWTMATGAIAAIAGVVASPLGAVIAIAIAAVAAFVHFSGAARAAVDLVGRQFASLRKLFDTTFGGILSALKRGDLAAAGEIAVAGLRVAFFQLLADLAIAFESVVETVGGVLARIRGYLAPVGVAIAGVAAVALVVWAPIIAAVLHLVELVRAVGPAIQTAIGSAAAFIANAWSSIDEAFGATFDRILAAAGGYFQGLKDTGNAAIDWLASRFEDLRKIATDAFGGIADALVGGEFGLAGEIAWGALQLAFMKGAADVATIWSEFSTGLVSMFDGAIVAVRKTWSDLSTWLAEKILTLAEMLRALVNSAAEIAPLLFEGSIAQKFLNSLPDMMQTVHTLREDRDRFQSELAKANEQRDQQRAEDMRTRVDESNAQIAALEAAQAALIAEAKAAEQNATGGVSFVDRALADLQGLLASNTEANDDQAKADAVAYQQKLDEMTVAVSATEDRADKFGGDTVGAFSAAAATMLSPAAEDAADRTAKATEATAEAVEVIAERVDNPRVWNA